MTQTPKSNENPLIETLQRDAKTKMEELGVKLALPSSIQDYAQTVVQYRQFLNTLISDTVRRADEEGAKRERERICESIIKIIAENNVKHYRSGFTEQYTMVIEKILDQVKSLLGSLTTPTETGKYEELPPRKVYDKPDGGYTETFTGYNKETSPKAECAHMWERCGGRVCTSDLHTHHCATCRKHAYNPITH